MSSIENQKEQNFDLTNLRIGYMNNPDKVFYNEMDSVIIQHLENKGAKVDSFTIDDIHFAMSKDGTEVYVKNQRVIWDGFLSYGYMSKFHYEAYLYIVSGIESCNIPTLHTSNNERILSNKFELSLKFAKSGLPIPLTHMGFSVQTYKSIAKDNYIGTGIIKNLDDYGGDGVSRTETNEALVNLAAKSLWKNEYCLFQKFIPDSIGRSVRVFCLQGKAIAAAECVDKSNSFKSNSSFGDFYEFRSLMNSEKFNMYAQLGEAAIKAVGDVLIGGVDILDSKAHGMVVLEINGWPDIFDIQHSTKINIFEAFATAFLEKCQISKNTK